MAQTGSHAVLDLVYIQKNGWRFVIKKLQQFLCSLKWYFMSANMGKTVPFIIVPSNMGAVHKTVFAVHAR